MSDSLSMVSLKEKKEAKLEAALKRYKLKLEEEKIFGGGNAPKEKDFVLFTALGDHWVKRPRASRKDFLQAARELVFLRNYIYSIGDRVPDETFLNTFENFDSSGNEEAYATAQRFLKTKDQPRGLWLHGPVSSGKSHLLYAAFAQRIYNAVDVCFKELDKDTYNQCPLFARNGRDGRAQENISVINYMTGKSYGSNDSPRFPGEHQFRPQRDELFLLDDVSDTRAEEVLEGLLSMERDHVGQVLITSNYSLPEWIAQNSGGKSKMGVEDRIRTFIREYEIKPKQKREKANW
jgi:hypothetical protein